MLKILGSLPTAVRPRPLPEMSAGTLRVSWEDFTTPDTAFHALSEFAGQGWLQDARVPKVFLFSDGVCPKLKEPWPEHGERVSDDLASSVQLRRVSAGWRLTTLTRQAGTENQVLRLERRLGHDLSCFVLYEVAWEPVPVGTPPLAHDELRPVASRFLGFVPRNASSRATL